MKKIFLIFIFFGSSFLFSNVHIYKDDDVLKNFELLYFHDENKSHTIESIQQIKFLKTTPNKFTFGYIKGNSWFKLHINNNTKNKQFIFQLLEPFFQEIHFYSKENQQWKKQNAGLTFYLNDKDKKHLQPIFPFSIEAHSNETIYINFAPKAGKTTACFGCFVLSTQKGFNYNSSFNDSLLYLFFFGSMFIIIIFNILLYVRFHERIYLYYTAYVFFFSIYIALYSGLILHIGLASWHKEFSISIPLFIIFLTLFSNSFLRISFYLPSVYKLLKAFISILVISIPLLLMNYDLWISKVTLFIIVLSPILLASTIYIAIKGHKEAKYYTVGIILFVLSLIITPLMTKAILPNNNLVHYAFIINAYLEITVFFFILVNRFYLLQDEKILLQNNLINIQKNNEKKLEQVINLRTQKIHNLLKDKEFLLKEVYHRVKNNFQMLITLLWLEQSKKESIAEKNSFLELINRIKSMSILHQYLLESDSFSKITSEVYLDQIIMEIKKSYPKNSFSIIKNLDNFIINDNQALSLGVIVNELITNAIKHHHKNTSVSIKITCKQLDENIVLTIQDNGSGFENTKENNGFGQELIQEFSKKLNAIRSAYSFQNGTKFVLIFKL